MIFLDLVSPGFWHNNNCSFRIPDTNPRGEVNCDFSNDFIPAGAQITRLQADRSDREPSCDTFTTSPVRGA